MVKDANGNEIVETPAPVVPAADGAVDEHGVPWKNRSLENERKLKALEEEQTRLNSELEEARKAIPAAAPAAEEEQPWERRARELARDEAKRERESYRAIDSKLGAMESDPTYGDAVKLYRRKIEERVGMLDIGMRANPLAIERTAKMVIGENLAELKERWSKPAGDGVARRLTPAPDSVSTGGEGGSGSGAGSRAGELSEEEVDFAERRGYIEKGFTVEEIKLRFKKNKDRTAK